MSAARTERLLNLLTLLLNSRRPISLREIRELPEFDAYCTEDPKSGERAFERDKAALVELGIPLRWIAPERDDDEDGGGYVIDRERYYLPELELSPSELALLSIAGAAAATIEGFWGRGAVIRALAKLGFDVDDYEARTAPALAHAPLAPGVDAVRLAAHLSALHDAVARQARVHLSYADIEGKASERDVDPYGLYYRQGAWYLVGFCHLRHAERTFHLGRVSEMRQVGRGIDFEVPASFDLSLHVQRRPWEYPGGKEEQVRILLAERLVPAVAEIFGPNATVEQTDEGAVVQLTVSQPAALTAAVLPYGSAALVLSPPKLRAAVGRVHAELAARYQKPAKKRSAG